MSTKDIVYIALFAAIYAALGLFPPIMLPVIGVPITAQSMGPMLAGSILGAKRGALASVLVAVGLPLLAGGRGGFGAFLGPSSGYMFAYPLAAFCIGLAFERLWDRMTFALAFAINVIGGIGIVYLIGIPWLAFVADLSFLQILTGSAGFLPGDIVKALTAAFVAVTVKKSYPIISARA
jgi:biotin transport system substrate-specific component